MSYEKLPSKDIRHHKGKSFVGITTSAICHDGNGRYFLNKRSENARDEQGMWDNCGGGLKVGFTVKDNAIREVQEEYGTTPLEVVELVYREFFREDNGVPTHWISFDFLCKIDPKEAKLNEPENASEVGWFTLDDLPSPRHSQFDITYAAYKDIFK